MSAAVERVNPIVVKEFRQAVQSRLVVVILTLFLLVNLAVVGGYLLTLAGGGHQRDRRAGGLRGLLGVLLFTCGLFVPLYVPAAPVPGAERREHRPVFHHDHFAWGHRPRQVRDGHGPDAADLQRLHALYRLHLSLRGVDLATIAWSLVLGFLASPASTPWASSPAASRQVGRCGVLALLCSPGWPYRGHVPFDGRDRGHEP